MRHSPHSANPPLPILHYAPAPPATRRLPKTLAAILGLLAIFLAVPAWLFGIGLLIGALSSHPMQYFASLLVIVLAILCTALSGPLLDHAFGN